MGRSTIWRLELSFLNKVTASESLFTGLSLAVNTNLYKNLAQSYLKIRNNQGKIGHKSVKIYRAENTLNKKMGTKEDPIES